MRPYGNIDVDGLRAWMKSHGLSRRKAADLLRVDPRTMSSWQKGREQDGLSNIPYAHWMVLRLYVAFTEQAGDDYIFDLLREVAGGINSEPSESLHSRSG